MRILFFSFSLLMLSGCIGEFFWEPETEYKPVLLQRSELEKSVVLEAPKPLLDPGKIYTYADYLFVNEKFKGIHIFDNSNPSSPLNLGFLRMPGNVDMALRDGILFADNAVDLVAVDLTDMENPVVVSRQRKVFQDIPAPDLGFVPYKFQEGQRPANTVIVSWEKQ